MLLAALGAALVGYAWSDDPWLGGEPGFGRTQQFVLVVGLLLAGCSLGGSRLRGRVLAIALASGAALVLAELMLWILLGCQLRQPYEFDSELWFRLRPGACAVFRHLPENGGKTIHYRINSNGFRGEELLQPARLPRVMVYGDSFIQAAFTSEKQTFTRRLADHLAEDFEMTAEVVNAGVASYGPDQSLLKMQRELPEYRPELVVMAVFAGNDFGDLERNKLFRLAGSGEIVRNQRAELASQLYARFTIAHREAYFKAALRRGSDGLWGQQLFPATVTQAADPAMARVEHWLELALGEHLNFVIQGDDVVKNVSVDFYNADVALLPSSASARSRRDLMSGVLRQIKETVAAAGARLLVVAIPHPMDVCGSHSSGKVDLERYPEYRRTNLTDAVVDCGRRAGVEVIDLYPLFDRTDCGSLYLAGGDDHWSDSGQDLAAKFLADAIISKKLLKSKQ